MNDERRELLDELERLNEAFERTDYEKLEQRRHEVARRLNELMVMTEQHERWSELLDRLDGPEGVNCQQDNRNTCYSDHRFATAILSKMGVDVEASLNYLTILGGTCDCKIVWNWTADGRMNPGCDDDPETGPWPWELIGEETR